MNPNPASMARMKRVATTFSALLALTRSSGSDGSSLAGGGFSSSSGRTSRALACAGGGVPTTRRGPSGVSSGVIPAGCSGPAGPLVSVIGRLSVLLRDNPHGRQDHGEQDAEERHETLGNRPDPAQAEAARVVF